MRFITFPVSSTNIFPLANSTAGGQLLSEWNLRSRETVGTNSGVKYEIGPSFTHSIDDFKISKSLDSTGQTIQTEGTILVISEGRAIVNGHYIQSLAPVKIDLAEANAKLQLNDRDPLKGELAVGLRAMYSTEQTMAGAMIPETKSAANNDNEEIDDTSNQMYYGIQVVILPVDEMKLPEDEKTNENNITAHLLLGTFEYSQGTVHNVIPNEERIKYIDGERIHNIEELLSDEYVSKGGLIPERLYVMSGKAHQPSDVEPWKDTWCDATNSLVVWRKQMEKTQTPPIKSAEFMVDSDSTVSLHLPHKQVDGMTDDHDNTIPAYFADTVLPIPSADYGANTPGIVTRAYTENLKLLASKLANVFQYSKGKQIAYKESITSKDQLPKINSAWNVGDYVLVKEDYSSEMGGDTSTYPSTLYAIIPGYITGVSYYGEVVDSDEIPSDLTGVELQSINIDEIPVQVASIAGEELGKYYFSNIPICSEMAQLILSGSLVYTVKTLDLFDDTSENSSETSSFVINTSPYRVGVNLSELHSSNDAFSDSYTNFSDSSVTFTNTSITLHKPLNKTWAQSGVAVGDTIVVIFDKTANKQSQVVSSTTMELQAGVDFNRITGEITSEIARQAIKALSAKGVYTYYKLTQTDLFSDYATFRGEPGKDYFVAIRSWTEGEGDNKVTHKTRYYFMISSAMPYEWSDAITITGRIYLAQESSIGGFYNVSSDKTDAGYVYLDADGHLKLRDYALLRSGTLAYQLGEDVEEFGSGEDISTIQETLDEYINDRVAFPSDEQRKKSSTPTVIHVTINLTDATPSTDSDTGTRNLFIRNIDSRFGTSVHFHFNGDATSKTIINFVDCEKIRIDSNICGTTMGSSYSKGPIINVYRCGLYYDPSVMNYIATCERPYDTDFSVYNYEDEVFYTDNYPSWFTGMQDISLWYQAYEDTDPRLTVDDMTVSDLDIAMESEDIDFWSPLAPNDNHYSAALSSLTFAKDGTIVRCGLLVADTSTTNIISKGEYLVLGKFTLPQGSGLLYPHGCLTRQLKISGSFTTAYCSDESRHEWHVSDTNFTALTETYDRYNIVNTDAIEGSIAFHEKVSIVTANPGDGINKILPFEPDTYHLFTGGIYC